ncbi:3-isopropylmalate dehydrogenase [Posidoniimonas polymericola]|uniref:3-isopropylmalate dehydrogenase n=1 Tax=Posidoniimonas polymericola TaxID=2528002 RepID=A0A5C5YD23_9BACT|nr:3-isopropylmalate dehydrogenase [Posidoniimonas polymericola]TWT72683.1 3-isopropylmalate dehydrogenase [Posidoniimonas polymericola]
MSQPLKIAQIAGDGIGPEVVGASLEVLRAAAHGCGLEYSVTEFPFSAAHFLETGHVLDDSDIEKLRGFDSILLGAVGGLPNDPRLAGGVIEKGILLKLRFELDQYINLRPVSLYPGIETPLKDKTAEHIDFVCVRENTEDLYCGVGGYVRKGTPQEVSSQTMVSTRFGVERCIRYAFELAKTRQRKNLTLVHKTNVLTFAGDTWHRAFKEVAEEYPEVETNYHHVDACCMYMVQRPEVYDVIVVPNMFGDIITDLGAAIAGGMGMAASGNLNPDGVAPSMFEPVHGSAPDIAGQNLANPIATIDSLGLLLRETGRIKQNAAAVKCGEQIGAAVKKVTPKFAGKNLDRSGYGTDEIGSMVADAL